MVTTKCKIIISIQPRRGCNPCGIVIENSLSHEHYTFVRYHIYRAIALLSIYEKYVKGKYSWTIFQNLVEITVTTKCKIIISYISENSLWHEHYTFVDFHIYRASRSLLIYDQYVKGKYSWNTIFQNPAESIVTTKCKIIISYTAPEGVQSLWDCHLKYLSHEYHNFVTKSYISRWINAVGNELFRVRYNTLSVLQPGGVNPIRGLH